MNHVSSPKLYLAVNDDAKNRWVNLRQWNEPIKETNGDDTLHFHLGFEITLSDFLYLLKISKMHCVFLISLSEKIHSKVDFF